MRRETTYPENIYFIQQKLDEWEREELFDLLKETTPVRPWYGMDLLRIERVYKLAKALAHKAFCDNPELRPIEHRTPLSFRHY